MFFGNVIISIIININRDLNSLNENAKPRIDQVQITKQLNEFIENRSNAKQLNECDRYSS